MLRTVLLDAVRAKSDVELDLARVEFIDSTGLGVLVDALTQVSDGQRFSITAASQPLNRLLDITGLTETFGLAPLDGSNRP